MYSMPKKWSRLTTAGLLAFSHVQAAQFVEHSDKQPIQVNISALESNRLAIDGRKLASVVPTQPGVISGTKDETLGVWYFSLASASAASGTVTLFVTDDQGATYRIVLVPRAIPAEDIVIRPNVETTAAGRGSGSAPVAAKAPSFQRQVKALILNMADDSQQGSRTDSVKVHKDVSLWREGRLTLEAKFPEAELMGEKYRLTNISPQAMLLAEQELYRRGVRAVSIKHQTLTPGDSTDIYIVRERRDDE